MIIGIDASRAAKKFKTGTEYYSIEIIKAISNIDRENQYILYSPVPLPKELENLPSNFSVKIMPFTKLWTQIRLSMYFLRHKPDIFFEPAHTLPIIYPKKTVVTLHDAAFNYYPELFTNFEKFYHPWSMKFSAKRATRIIAPSEDTKKDIIKFYNVAPDKITVIYHGLNREIFIPDKRSSYKHGKYILFIGRLEEKKNVLGLIKAYEILRQRGDITHKLVLVGRDGFGIERIKEAINALPVKIAKDVIITGYISQDEKVKLLQNADLFVLPSFFEGFGLPILEAMACGCPVACSNITSLPEIAADAAMMFDPYKSKEISEAMTKIILNPKLKNELITKGFQRANTFSWEKAGEKTLEVILNSLQ